jgi:hypothetical protein
MTKPSELHYFFVDPTNFLNTLSFNPQERSKMKTILHVSQFFEQLACGARDHQLLWETDEDILAH